ncbi:MAG: hypothetical protein PUD34_03865 [bacterium]|nr:hypothetical protein [bacterium]
MKRCKLFIIALSLMLLVSGCSNVNTTMKINKDKSMNLSYIISLDKNYLGNKTFNDLFSSKNINNLENNGYSVTDYEDDNNFGYKISTNVKDIDNISSSEDLKINLLSLLYSNVQDELYIFKRTDGVLKNQYEANFSVDLSEALQENPNILTNMVTTPVLSYSFSLELPSEVITSNATNISADKKTLTWQFDNIYNNHSNITFTFEAYNKPMLYMLYVGIGLLGLIILSTIVRTLMWISDTFKKIKKNRYIRAQRKMEKKLAKSRLKEEQQINNTDTENTDNNNRFIM